MTIRPWKDSPVVEATVIAAEPASSRPGAALDEAELHEARDGAVARASLSVVPHGRGALYGTARFFADAAEQLSVSTAHGLELAGAVYATQVGERTLLLGLKRCASGSPGRVVVEPEWGEILWHTHPGMKGSLAAFSNEDLEAAKRVRRPLLVVGFGGLSPDVLSTLALPFGYRSLLAATGVKALLSLEKRGRLRQRLIRMGVAARVCYPSGRIQPVIRTRATPLEYALDDASFLIDRTLGSIERRGQAAVRRALRRLWAGPSS
ncbi:MAG: hypothetical protein ACO3JL_02570 [Myxococcota bacterium]